MAPAPSRIAWPSTHRADCVTEGVRVAPASAGEKVGVLGCLARAEGARDSDGWTRAGGKPRALSRVCQRGVVAARGRKAVSSGQRRRKRRAPGPDVGASRPAPAQPR